MSLLDQTSTTLACIELHRVKWDVLAVSLFLSYLLKVMSFFCFFLILTSFIWIPVHPIRFRWFLIVNQWPFATRTSEGERLLVASCLPHTIACPWQYSWLVPLTLWCSNPWGSPGAVVAPGTPGAKVVASAVDVNYGWRAPCDDGLLGDDLLKMINHHLTISGPLLTTISHYHWLLGSCWPVGDQKIVIYVQFTGQFPAPVAGVTRSVP